MKKFNYVYISGILAIDPKKAKLKKDKYGNYIFDCNYLCNEPFRYSDNELDFGIYVYDTESLNEVSNWGDDIKNVENSSIKDVFNYIKELYSKNYIKNSKSFETLSISFYEIANSKAKYVLYSYEPNKGKLKYTHYYETRDDKNLLF